MKWTAHSGGPQPVSGAVTVQTLDGDIDTADADEFVWEHAALGGFFVGYIVRYCCAEATQTDGAVHDKAFA